MRRLIVGMAVLLVSMILAILFLKLKVNNQTPAPGRAVNRGLKDFIGEKCDRGRTTLMRRAGELRPATVAALISAGADLHAKDAIGMTALKHAAREHDPGTVRVLLEAGADVNAADSHKMTALMWAVRVDFSGVGPEADAREAYISRMAETVRVLIEAGADVNAGDEYGHTPACHASRFDLSKIAAFRPDPAIFPPEDYYQVALGCLRLIEDAGAKDAADYREDFIERNIEARLNNLPLLNLWDESKVDINIARISDREIGLPRLEDGKYRLRIDYRRGGEEIFSYDSLSAALFDRDVIEEARLLYSYP